MSNTVFKILFNNNGKVYEIYARQLDQSTMFGFIEIEELIFGEKSSLVVDPSEEKLKTEFTGVKRTYVPMHAIIRIDEVEREGVNKVLPGTDNSENVTPFPGSAIYPPRKDSN